MLFVCYKKCSTCRKAQGAVTDAYGYCRWWLRTPGKNSGSAVIVDTYGTVVFEGVGADNDRICAIRPAVWVLGFNAGYFLDNSSPKS